MTDQEIFVKHLAEMSPSERDALFFFFKKIRRAEAKSCQKEKRR
jgi:hypothetical protein